MKPEVFDTITRHAGNGMSRRRILQLVGLGSAATLVGVNTLPGSAAAARPGCGVRSLLFWLNTFIPGDVAGSRTVPAGPYAGFSMIEGPFSGISDCFLTDQRSFDSRVGTFQEDHPSARVAAFVSIDVENATIFSQTMFTKHTVEVDCEDGDVECDVFPQAQGPGFHDISRFGNRITLQVKGWAHDPCFTFTPGIFIPDVDFEGTITIDVEDNGEVGVTFEGAVDVFPAFEIYVMPDGGGETRTLLQRYPDQGVSAGDLTFSQLAVPVFAQTTLNNTTTCSDPNQVCCQIGTNNEQCCPSDKPVCCPNSLGGGCCEGGWGCCPPGRNGEHICCLPGWSCCGDTQLAANGCCPPESRLCCPLEAGGGCCPDASPLCCPGDPPFCCPESHPICVNDPQRGPLCGRPRQGVTAERARETGQFESTVPARHKQAARSTAPAAVSLATKETRHAGVRPEAPVRSWRPPSTPKAR
jgi:hypothetical protein